MPAEIESFEEAHRARHGAPGARSFPLTERYILRAEEALRLLVAMPTEHERRTVCQITETWLSLAEESLRQAAARP
jgi:hypothetical protein